MVASRFCLRALLNTNTSMVHTCTSMVHLGDRNNGKMSLNHEEFEGVRIVMCCDGNAQTIISNQTQRFSPYTKPQSLHTKGQKRTAPPVSTVSFDAVPGGGCRVGQADVQHKRITS